MIFTKVIAVFLVGCCSVILANMMVGGISNNENPPNGEVQGMLDTLNTEIKLKTFQLVSGTDGGASNTEKENEIQDRINSANITVLGYKTQIVAGINYFVKAKIGDQIFHLRIYRDLKKNVSLTKVIGPKSESDPIGYF